MLNYTTTNILNDVTDVKIIQNAPNSKDALKLVIPGAGILRSDAEHEVKCIYVTKPSEAELAEAEVDLSKIDTAEDDDIHRIRVYMRLYGDNASTYANTWNYKGVEMFLGEFIPSKANVYTVTKFDVSNLGLDKSLLGKTSPAVYVAKIAKKFNLAQYGTNLLDVTVLDENKLSIKAKNPFVQFRDQDNNFGVSIQSHAVSNANIYVGSEEWVAADFTDANSGITMVCQGKEAFGDSFHLMRDFRLPTGDNTSWYGSAKASGDMPIEGQYYAQITLYYDAERGLQQGDALGGLAKSRTCHVYWVPTTQLRKVWGNTNDASYGATAAELKDAGEKGTELATGAVDGDKAEVFISLLMATFPTAIVEYQNVPTSKN